MASFHVLLSDHWSDKGGTGMTFLALNQLLEFTEDGHIERVLWFDAQQPGYTVIDIQAEHANPVYRRHEDVVRLQEEGVIPLFRKFDSCCCRVIPSAVLLLAGDIFTAAPLPERKTDAGSRSLRKRYSRFIREELTKYQLVLYIAGNREFYGSVIGEAPGILSAFFTGHGGTVRLLEKEAVEIEGVAILAATLRASHGCPDPLKAFRIGSTLNDFRLIKTRGKAGGGNPAKGERAFRPEDAAFEHELACQWLARALGEYGKAGKPCIVFTHHAPSYLSADRQAYPDDCLDDAFYSDQSALFEQNPQLRLWAHGHTHRNCCCRLGAHGALVVANQRGYATEKSARDFDARGAEFELEAIKQG